MVMAPPNVQILPEHAHLPSGHHHHQHGHHHHLQPNGGHHKSARKQRQQNRSPKKFMVFPVAEVGCEPRAKGEGRIVMAEKANWNWKKQAEEGRKRRRSEEAEEEEARKGKAEEEEKNKRQSMAIEEIGENAREDGEEKNVKMHKREEKEEECRKEEEGMASGRKRQQRIVQMPAISTPKWTTGPMGVRAKVILLGESGVGKTSLVYSLKYGCTGLLPCNATIGAHHTNFDMTALDNMVPVQVQLWDTAGQERFRSMVPMYLRNINAALVVYDITNRNSYDEIDFWIREISCHTASEGKKPILVLVGNKKDQAAEREVGPEEGMAKAVQFDAHFFELTTVDTKAIRLLFQSLADQLAERLSPKFDEVEEVDEGTQLGEKEGGEEEAKNPVIRLEREMLRELAAFWKKNGGGLAIGGCCSAQ